MAFSSISDLWNVWNVRCFIILSLSLQVFLILFAPIRKKTIFPSILSILWLAYLMADWVAAFGVGLISHNQGNSCACAVEVDGAIQAFWASFLLLHLGGPDTITAFSLEDSLLWQRHLLSLIFQVVGAFYVFVQIFPSDKSLVIPTILIFLAAVIKNVERTLALKFSSLQSFRESMLSMPRADGAIISWDEADKRLVEELDALGYRYSDKGEAKLPKTIAVKHAYSFFRIFKVVIADLMFTKDQREMSRKYFFKVSAMDALRVISIELNFIYEVLYTKALVIHSKWSYIFRLIAFIHIVIAFVLFNRLKKHQLPKIDVEITYTLLFGGIALDVISLFMLVFSDRSLVDINQDSFLYKLVSAMYSLRKPRFITVEANHNVTYAALGTSFLFRRWSEYMRTCNLLSILLKQLPNTMRRRYQHWYITAFHCICNIPLVMLEIIPFCYSLAIKTIGESCGLRTKRSVSWGFVSVNPFITDLWIFIFEEVRLRSVNADNLSRVREIFEARGALSLKDCTREINWSHTLESYFTDTNFDISILALHVATEMWYNTEKPHYTRNDEREFSKILSDYMLYLLLFQPNVVSAVAGVSQISSEVVLLQLRELLDDAAKDLKTADALMDMKWLCSTLYGRSLHGESPIGESPMFARLRSMAIDMEKLGEMKWRVISRVWVEMLSYVAVHIKGEAHVKGLSKGGELLTFVWLLMVHFGCFYNPGYGMHL